MKLTLKLAAICALVAASSSIPSAARLAPTALAPALTSVGPIQFGADGMLYVADPLAATIFALDLGAQGTGAMAGTAAVPGLDQKIAAMLGTAATTLTITDLAVHPVSHNSFVSVSRGQGAAAQPALIRIDGAGKLDLVSMDTVKFTSIALPNPANVSTTGRGGRTQSVTDMALVGGRLYVAGLSNEEFASKLWSVAVPFAKADNGTSVEIYHGNHGGFETRSPVMTFLPMTVNGQQSLVAGYTCTPLVRFQISGLSAGQKVVGTTMMDLGAGNQPLDMVSYNKGGQDALLISNSNKGVIKVPTAQFATLPSITAKVDTAGAFEPIAAMAGIKQMDKLDAQRVVTIALADGAQNLAVSQLP